MPVWFAAQAAATIDGGGYMLQETCSTEFTAVLPGFLTQKDGGLHSFAVLFDRRNTDGYRDP